MQTDLLKGKPIGLIGIDEAGKGDYFGPLVIAACYCNDSIEDEFFKIGLKESKAVSDGRSFALESQIKSIAPHSVVTILPEKYNQLYNKIRNLNRLLAWGHARALENLLAEVNPIKAISDQFGDKRLIERALMERGQAIELVQRTKAEAIPAVAAASILARAEFLRRLTNLSTQHKIKLPKGAGEQVDLAARNYVEMYGRENLDNVAKIHFKNTSRVSG